VYDVDGPLLSRVYVRKDRGIGLYRVSFNRWELERRGEGWKIARRTTRLLGHEEAKAILEVALRG